ncbi:MAG: hypothetical protein WC777_00350 [Candidatus Gracilibacteria bacterium]|jgi:hypothetical protein
MSENIKKISKKKILFVQIDEEITSLFQRVEKLPYKEVYLVVPKRAVLLQSIVNLKILKQRLAEMGKEVAVITNDLNGMKLAHQAEIKVFDHWNIDEAANNTDKKDEKDPQSALLKPIAAAQNEVEDELPSRLPKKKSSIFEVVRNLKNKDKGFSLRSYLADLKKNRLGARPLNLYLTPGKRRLVFGLLGSSLLVFFLIAYIALPGATVLIEPASNVISKAVNIVLEPNPSDPRSLQAYTVETEVEYTLTHPATGLITDESSNASGNLTILNTSSIERPLVKETRFQTEDGIVFRLQAEVIVPAASSAGPGSLVAFVVADPLDANGVAVGERGNIPASKFFLPGLKEDSRDEVYAESYDAMTGGQTVSRVQITENDLIAAQAQIEKDLNEKAVAALRKEVLAESNAQGLQLKLLETSDALNYGPVLASLPYALVGQEQDSFEVTGTMTISGVAYRQDELFSILRAEIVSAKTPGKRLVSVDEDSISLQVLELNESAGSFKITAQIQGIEQYEIDPDLEGGNQLAEKIKEHIAGRSIEEAKAYIQNLPEVNSVEISVWPVWSPTISSLPENIKIKSLSEEEGIE